MFAASCTCAGQQPSSASAQVYVLFVQYKLQELYMRARRRRRPGAVRTARAGQWPESVSGCARAAHIIITVINL